MQHLIVTISFCLLAISLTGQVNTQEGFMDDNRLHETEAINQNRNANQGQIDFFTDFGALQQVCSNLMLVDGGMENTLVAAMGFAECSDPTLNSMTDNNCYAPGGLTDGFTISSQLGELIIRGDDFFGLNLPPSIATRFFSDDLIVSFQEPVNTVCLNLVDVFFNAGTPLQIDVSGANGLLGQSNTTLDGTTPITVCMTADENIESISINDMDTNVYLSGISFGNCASEELNIIPTLQEWGMICLCLLFLIIGATCIKSQADLELSC